LPEGDNLLLRANGACRSATAFRILRKLASAVRVRHRSKSLVQHDVQDDKEEERVGLAPEIRRCDCNRSVYDGGSIALVRDRLSFCAEQVLVDAVSFRRTVSKRLETFRETVKRIGVETLRNPTHEPSRSLTHDLEVRGVDTSGLRHRFA